MTHRFMINMWLILLAPLAYGCVGQTTAPNPIYYYTVDYEPRPIVLTPALPRVLQVQRFSASPPFNTQRMIYADKGLHRNSYGYHQWIDSPGELIPYLLTRDLRLSKGFQAVLTPDASLPATHHIYGWIEQFVELDKADSPHAMIRLHITLVSALETHLDRRVLFQSVYQKQTPCKGETPGALAKAMSAAVAQINREVIEDIYQRLNADASNHRTTP